MDLFICLFVLGVLSPVVFPASCRSFAKPPHQVQVVCECILVIRGYKEINWKTAKGMMSEANFLRSLMEMDCDSISKGQVNTVRGEMCCDKLIFLFVCLFIFDSKRFFYQYAHQFMKFKRYTNYKLTGDGSKMFVKLLCCYLLLDL